MYFLGTAEVEKLILFLTIFIREFDLCPLSEAVLYSYLSFGGTCSVCCLEIGRCLSLRG